MSRDFDFEFGTWRVRHRRLKERLAGCQDWEEFSGESETRPALEAVEDRTIESSQSWMGSSAIPQCSTPPLPGEVRRG